MMQKMSVYYDGECPFCSQYTNFINLKNAIDGDIELINVRNDLSAQKEIENMSLNINQGMVVKIDDKYFHGAKAVNIMALMSTASDKFNKFNKLVFSSFLLTWILYPFMVFVRNLTLAMLGRGKIVVEHQKNHGSEGLERYYLFAWSWGIYTIFHFMYLVFYTETIASPPNALSWLMLCLAFGVVYSPKIKQLFSALIIVQILEMLSQMPATSNHAIIELFFLIAIVFTGLQALINQKSWEEYFELFAPSGRWLLVIMYFFGIFHKINADFLNPESSCAVALWLEYPFPSIISNSLWTHYMAIYATFVVEGFVMIALFFHRTRYYAVVVGIAFHLFLGVNSYAFYGPFSFLSFALHTLFLPGTILAGLRKTRVYKVIQENENYYLLMLLTYIGALYYAAFSHQLWMLIVLFVLISVPLLILVTVTINQQSEAKAKEKMLIPGGVVFVVVVAFFLNNAAPYMGLKTHQSLNMFANLHLEGGRSNHLVFTNPPFLFSYLDDTVKIIETRNEKGEAIPFVGKYHVVYHDFLAIMSNKKNVIITYERDGKLYKDMTYQTLQKDIKKIVQPVWLRRWMHFAAVDYRQPKPCEGFK